MKLKPGQYQHLADKLMETYQLAIVILMAAPILIGLTALFLAKR